MPRGLTTLGLFFPPRVCSWDACTESSVHPIETMFLKIFMDHTRGSSRETGGVKLVRVERPEDHDE